MAAFFAPLERPFSKARSYTVTGNSFSGSACTSSTISPSTTSTPTRPPLTSLPKSSSSASAR